MTDKSGNAKNASRVNEELNTIKETLSVINTRELVLTVLTSIVLVLMLAIIGFMICDRRKKSKQGSVPQAIVIQPNANSGRSARATAAATKSKEKPNKVSVYEKDVLPSKSMKMKVNITQSSASSKSSKRKGVSVSDRPSNDDISSIPSVPMAVIPPASGNTTPPAASVPSSTEPVKPASKEAESIAPPVITVAPPSAELKTLTPATSVEMSTATSGDKKRVESKTSTSNDSFSSFTVNGDDRTNVSITSNLPAPTSKSSGLIATPTVTTLSGCEPTASKPTPLSSTTATGGPFTTTATAGTASLAADANSTIPVAKTASPVMKAPDAAPTPTIATEKKVSESMVFDVRRFEHILRFEVPELLPSYGTWV
ncbi:unnamed protein product [Caenorhabditis bovis]|uniref:Uncharacterized protein n=1 Tax=Caenorhabditis bovis TaxID=2654633 RepID=A0A8S1EYD5_9PELO|nr:unnamed protein product [Caenorhabditis bovis]